jgi:hypothetical protein
LENDINNSTSKDLTYQGIVDGIMVELHQKYNLRPRNRSLSIAQMKNILPMGETNEMVSENDEKQTEETNIMDT